MVMVKVLAFARYRELLGFGETELPLPDPPCLGELLKDPCFAQLPPNALFAVNRVFVNTDATLDADDEVAVMPPVSGG
jgi:molybdopterin converting factor small subunit